MSLFDFLKSNKKEPIEPDVSGYQKMLHDIYPKLKGIDFRAVKHGTSGSSPIELFTSDIDGDWHYTTLQMTMLFKACSKDKIESELKLLLNQNEILFDDVIQKTEILPEHWKGDGFNVEHPIIGGIDIIIITNENVTPQHFTTLHRTDLAPEVQLPTGYENIGIEHVYDGSRFLEETRGKLSLNIPLLFNNDDGSHTILIGVTTLNLAKRIIDDILEKNYGKQYFREYNEEGGWQYLYGNEFFQIGFVATHNFVRINMLHNLVDLREN